MKLKKARQEGLWMPNSIWNLPELNWGEKALLAHFYSFGEKGCWKSNKTLAEEFMTSKQTISRMITRLKKYIWIKNPKGYYRTIWVKSHPKVKDFIPGKESEVNQKCASGLVKNDNSTSSKQAIGHNQKCATTYTHTNKENYKREAVDLPLPAGGQASQLLIERKAKTMADIEAFKRRFGNGPHGGRDNRPAMTPEEREKRKQELIRGLDTAEKMDKLLSNRK